MATQTQFKPLMKGKYDPTSHQAINDFLNEVWDYCDEVYTFLCTQDRNGGSWREHAIQVDRSSCITQLLEAYSPRKFDWYFCPNSFAEPKRQRSCALPTHYAWADIDDAEPALHAAANDALEDIPGTLSRALAVQPAAECQRSRGSIQETVEGVRR